MNELMASLIRAESKKNGLPFVGSWNTQPNGYGPNFQIELLEQNTPIIPWFHLPEDKIELDYYFPLLDKCNRHNLPISFVCTQLERLLPEEYFLTNLDGTKTNIVNPFSPIKAWRELGDKWNNQINKIKKYYRDPPLTMLVSNNEQPKLRWTNTEYIEFIGQTLGVNLERQNLTEETKRKLIADNYYERYKLLLEGIQARTVGYNAYVPSFIGRWSEWTKYSLHTERLTPWTCWNGHSTSLYQTGGCGDDKFWSVQSESMNLYELFKQINMWNEISVWNNQTEGVDRYEGAVQFCMWMCRPNLVRDFRPHTDGLKNEKYFNTVANCVRRIYNDAKLQDYWFNSTPIPTGPHFYKHQNLIKNEWFLLKTNPGPNKEGYNEKIPVFAVAFKHNTHNEIMIYAHSPENLECAIDLQGSRVYNGLIPKEGKFIFVT